MLTPIDIQNHVLKSTMGGYNKKETDDFIESIQASYEQLYKENHDLKEKITALSEGLQYYKKMEGTLQKTLVLAEKTATETLEASRTKASRVEKESQEKANAMLSSAKAKADSIVGESESKVNALLAKSQAKADSLLAESRAKADAAVAEAQKKADKLIANANERVERVLEDAKESADDLLNKTREATEQSLNDANRQLNEVSSIMRKLMDCYDQYKEQFKALLNRQLAQLDDPAFLIHVPDLESILESQQVSIAERQTSLLNKLDEIASQKEELNVSMKETSPEIEKIEFSIAEDETPGFSVSDKENGFSTDVNWEVQSLENAADTSFGAGTEKYSTDMPDKSFDFDTDYTTAQETVEKETTFVSGNESVLSNADDAGKIEGTPYDNDAPDLEALAKLADAAASAEPSMEPSMDTSNAPKAHEPDFADIALEALRRANTDVIPKAPLSSDESSMLGTSYDDFVPASQNTAEAQNTSEAYSGAEADFSFAAGEANQNGQKTVPMPSFVTSLETPSYEEQPDQPFMPMPDFTKAMEAMETSSSEGQPEQPLTPMPDFAKAMDAPSFEGQPGQPFMPMSGSANSMESPSFETQPEQPSIPMPDFAKAMEMPSFDSAPEQPVVPMPDFARAAMDEPSLGAAPEQETGSYVQSEPMPDFLGEGAASFGAAAEQPINADAYSDTALHAENYITAETYFGSADNIPYTGGAAVDFSNGITGGEQMDAAPDGTADLFSADFSGVTAAPSDEFAVSGSPSNSGQGTPFTFIDANEVN